MSWRPARLDDMPLAGVWALAAASAVALTPLLRAWSGLLPPCPLHVLTSLPCPTCGATRAALRLADGQAIEALAINPLATIGLGMGVVGGLLSPAWVALSGPIPIVTPRRAARIAVIAVLALNWVYLVIRRV
ncbi:MAG TPA: DUF2752 domain-containing protein [Candidatus Limnocylindrales bacterium]|nr:DUF2752 domain-containing protein [Candidatus Limnocylindrales bacterium]